MERVVVCFLLTIGCALAATPRYTLLGKASQGYITVPEDYAVNTTLFQIQATHSDPNDKLALVASDKLTGEYVKIIGPTTGNNVTFNITLVKEFDRETIGISLDVYITDVNDNSPVFDKHPYTWDLHEQPCNDTDDPMNNFTSIHADDKDNSANGRVTYSMEPKSEYNETKNLYSETFKINKTTGVVWQKKCVDYEKNSYYQFVVTAKDGGPDGRLNATVDFIIRVKDDQDTPPFFTRNSFRETVYENRPIETNITTVQAIDGDRGVSQQVNYTAVSNCNGSFEIDATTGVISTHKHLDRDQGIFSDNQGECIISITASEINQTGVEQYNTTETNINVTITVKDVNDNAPNFTNCPATATVNENTPGGIPVKFDTYLRVEDIDQGGNAHMDISIKCSNGIDCSTFSVSPKQIQGAGNITVLVSNNTLLDFEKLQQINITVIATDRKNTSYQAEFDVTVCILDVNDKDPKFNDTSYTLEIEENSSNGTTVGTITATDEDKSVKFNTLKYSIVGGNGKFAVNDTTGRIYTICHQCNESFDRETQDTYFVTYTATDYDTRRDSVSIKVKVLDKNDNAPMFSSATYLVYKKENDHDLHVIKVMASDKDESNSNNSRFHFNVNTTTDSNFNSYKNLTINDDGWIMLNKSIDYEALSSDTRKTGIVNITIMVHDDGVPSKSSSAMVQLTIQDMNDNSPIFLERQYNYTLHENATTKNVNDATQVGNVSAVDQDGNDRNSHINYLIQDGGADRFDIGYTSGMVKVRMNAVFDRETQSNYNLTILAIDQGSPPRNASTTMFVEILDVNDEAPTFSERLYTTTILEDARINTSMIQCSATDKDEDSKLRYSISIAHARNEDGKPVNTSLVQDYFDIDTENGSVYVKSELDRETAKTVTITVSVEDKAAYFPSPQNDTAILTVTLLDVNDNDPNFDEKMYEASVPENAKNGNILIQTTATDRDENRTMTYELQDPNSSFQINTETGWITKKGDLDREKVAFVQLVVLATDNGVPDRSSNVTVNVTIEDFNDNPPVFTTSNRTVHIKENVDVNEEVIHINATDADTGPNANLTFKLKVNDDKFSGYFAINATTGIITVNKSLDREKIDQFRLYIVANDNPDDKKVQKTAEKSLLVKIEDVNDNPPIFSKPLYKAGIVEDAKINSTITSITAYDADEGINKELEYVIIGEKNLFSIDNNGTIKVNSSLRDKVGNYSVTVQAFDHGKPEMNGSTSVNISVTDVNLHSPIIQNVPPYKEISVYECARKGTIIHTFNYTDADKGDNARADFNISEISGNSTAVFKMNPNGSLEVQAAKLDAGVISQYKFQVQATDKGKPAPLKSEIITITVNILDVNDHNPSFRKTEMSMTVKENTTSDVAIGQVEAYDQDEDSNSCYYIDSTNQQNFIVEDTTGEIFYNQSVDYETNHNVTFKVNVTDCSLKKNVDDYCNKISGDTIKQVNKDVNETIEVTVNVIDIDDNPPIFLSDTLSAGMRRNTEPGTVLTLNLRNESYIHDKDTAPNGVLSWKFKNYGNITTSANLRDKIHTNSGTELCEDNIKHIFCITSNGTIVNNKYFSEDLTGYFIVTVEVSDKGGSDTADLIIYLISDTQILSMNIRHNKERVAGFKDALLAQLSNILGPYTAVFDNLQDHKENDQVTSSSSDLHFHIVRSDTQEVISGNEAIRLLDSAANSNEMLGLKNNFNVMTVSKQQMSDTQKEESSKKTFFILLAVSISEALIITIVVYVSLATKNKYQRKLKAAYIKPADMELHIVEQETVAIPGSNMYAKLHNPLLNAELEEQPYDNIHADGSEAGGDSLNLDDNNVDDQQMVYDRMEEREVTLDMYTDDTVNNVSSEDLLESALNYHQMKKSMESLDKLDLDYEHVDGNSFSGSVPLDNYAYDEELESTEI